MKKVRLLIITIFLVSLGWVAMGQTEVDQNGYNVFYHPNGEISSEGTMRDGKPDGYWKTYNDSGILISEGNREDFKLDSTWKFYDEEGELKMLINYKEGKKHGIRKTYREDEILEERFENDIKQGMTNIYYADGTLKKSIPFENGLEDGLALEYGKDGRIITMIRYKKGFITERELINRYDAAGKKHGPWKYFYANGRVKREGTYRHGKEEGYFKEYDLAGNLMTTAKFNEGVLQEDVAELKKLEVRKDYYPDGQVKISATYNEEGNLEGIRREFAEDGSIENSYIFKNGILIGEGIVTEKGEKDGFWKEYYDSGRLRGEGRYSKDIREGEWKFYHENGELEQQGAYLAGKPEGDWFWYHDNGQLLREEYYFNGLQDGKMTEYDREGEIVTRGEYIEGKRLGEWYFRIGMTETTGVYSDDMRNGLWRTWDLPSFMGREKTLRFEGRFIEDNPHGEHTWYWDNGNRKEQGEYVMGRKEGQWIYYNYDGTPYLVVTYENGFEKEYDGMKLEGVVVGME